MAKLTPLILREGKTAARKTKTVAAISVVIESVTARKEEKLHRKLRMLTGASSHRETMINVWTAKSHKEVRKNNSVVDRLIGLTKKAIAPKTITPKTERIKMSRKRLTEKETKRISAALSSNS